MTSVLLVWDFPIFYLLQDYTYIEVFLAYDSTHGSVWDWFCPLLTAQAHRCEGEAPPVTDRSNQNPLVTGIVQEAA